MNDRDAMKVDWLLSRSFLCPPALLLLIIYSTIQQLCLWSCLYASVFVFVLCASLIFFLRAFNIIW